MFRVARVSIKTVSIKTVFVRYSYGTRYCAKISIRLKPGTGPGEELRTDAAADGQQSRGMRLPVPLYCKKKSSSLHVHRVH